MDQDWINMSFIEITYEVHHNFEATDGSSNTLILLLSLNVEIDVDS